jgi:hypothetical protein
MTAKIDLQKFSKDIEKRLKVSASRPEMLRLGNFVLNLIKARVRQGFGVSENGGQKEDLKELSRSYKKQRAKLRLSPFTTPTKSNLTRSGRLIGGLRVAVQNGVVIIRPSGTSREGTPNQKVAEYVSKDRPFLFMTKSEVQSAAEYFEKEILRKNLK